MSKSPLDLLLHIADEVEFLLNESSSMDESVFQLDEKAKRAFARSFEVIGEASKCVPDDLKSKYPDIDWKSMARMRDRLIPHYFGVDYSVVWDTVINDIPYLYEAINSIIKDISVAER